MTNFVTFFLYEIYATPLRNYVANETVVPCIDSIWSLGLSELSDHGPKINQSNSYPLVVIDNSSRFGRTVTVQI